MPDIYNPDGNIVQRHPAETIMPIATVIAALISKALGVEDTDTIFYIALLVSFVPAAITWIVNMVKGKEPPPPPPKTTARTRTK